MMDWELKWAVALDHSGVDCGLGEVNFTVSKPRSGPVIMKNRNTAEKNGA